MVNWIICIFFIFFIFLFLIYTFGNREKIHFNDFKQEEIYSFYENDQGKTAYYLIGKDNSEPLILIHGVTVPSYYYKKIAQSLSKIGYRVYAYDHFGRGFSERPKLKYEMNMFEKQLDDFINHLSYEKITLLGVSMGGSLASNYTAQNPERVKSLILNVPFVGDQSIGINKFSNIPFFWNFYLRFFVIKKLIDRGLGLTEYDQDLDHFIKQFSIKGTQRSFSSLAKNFMKHDFYNDYRLINSNKTPVHITYAVDDEDVPSESVLKAIKLIPDARVFAFEGGHNIINVKTEQIVKLINDFKLEIKND